MVADPVPVSLYLMQHRLIGDSAQLSIGRRVGVMGYSVWAVGLLSRKKPLYVDRKVILLMFFTVSLSGFSRDYRYEVVVLRLRWHLWICSGSHCSRNTVGRCFAHGSAVAQAMLHLWRPSRIGSTSGVQLSSAWGSQIIEGTLLFACLRAHSLYPALVYRTQPLQHVSLFEFHVVLALSADGLFGQWQWFSPLQIAVNIGHFCVLFELPASKSLLVHRLPGKQGFWTDPSYLPRCLPQSQSWHTQDPFRLIFVLLFLLGVGPSKADSN